MHAAPVSRPRLDGLSRKAAQSQAGSPPRRRTVRDRTDRRRKTALRSARVTLRVDLAEQPLHAREMLLIVAAQVMQ